MPQTDPLAVVVAVGSQTPVGHRQNHIPRAGVGSICGVSDPALHPPGPGSPVCSAAVVLAAPGGGGSMRGPTAPQARVPRRRWRRWQQGRQRRHLAATPAFLHHSRGPVKEEPRAPLLAD